MERRRGQTRGATQHADVGYIDTVRNGKPPENDTARVQCNCAEQQ